MIEIPLAHGLGIALVDASDHELVAGRRWHLHAQGYACTGGGSSRSLMHRLILNLAKGDGHSVDHINRDKLDNRRANLRICTHAENMQNLGAKGGSSQYRGVSWDSKRQTWVADVSPEGKKKTLGRFATELDAAKAAARWRHEHLPFSVEDPALLGGSHEDVPRECAPRFRKIQADAIRWRGIEALYESGLSAREVGERFGLTRDQVHGVLKMQRRRRAAHPDLFCTADDHEAAA